MLRRYSQEALEKLPRFRTTPHIEEVDELDQCSGVAVAVEMYLLGNAREPVNVAVVTDAQ